ncbi:hypothetical protein DUNSADRAFT_13181 [Dunaliella salina]|uniref:Uncharacterized protein n=1 Tax=Dunaliella salina TaxID=3046 RepID=A0ABQ7G9W2_DUNSA|nr:hypothetical protein DUNSADRAFT_13181 [Dunaliella salina]|eukprot:KAF5831391.1 hypothetical protein DUNSADRAFT_13181 [Dunaliella salina]
MGLSSPPNQGHALAAGSSSKAYQQQQRQDGGQQQQQQQQQQQPEQLFEAPGSVSSPPLDDSLEVGKDMQEFLEAFLASEATEEDRSTPALAGSRDAGPEAQCSNNSQAPQAAAAATPVVAGNTQRTDVCIPRPSLDGPRHAAGTDAGHNTADSFVPVCDGARWGGGGPAAGVAAKADVCSQEGCKERSADNMGAADQTLFLSWQMLDQRAKGDELATRERDLKDALTLLPDFEHLAKSMVTQHGDLIPSNAHSFHLDLAAMMY